MQSAARRAEDELRFRKECASGGLHFMASGAMRVDLEAMTGEERLLVPAIAGTLTGEAA